MCKSVNTSYSVGKRKEKTPLKSGKKFLPLYCLSGDRQRDRWAMEANLMPPAPIILNLRVLSLLSRFLLHRQHDKVWYLKFYALAEWLVDGTMLICLWFKMFLGDPPSFNGNRHSLRTKFGDRNSGKQNLFNTNLPGAHKRNLSI